jgi:hypothetical protein
MVMNVSSNAYWVIEKRNAKYYIFIFPISLGLKNKKIKNKTLIANRHYHISSMKKNVLLCQKN